MKFKLDENVPFSIKGIIESSGDHLVDSVHHEKLDGTRGSALLFRVSISFLPARDHPFREP